MEREIIVREQLLEHKFVTNSLNIQKCNICLECHIEKDVIIKQDSYTCKTCKDRNDPNHFIKIICIHFGMKLKKMGHSK
jgi:hypothetical protein